MAWEWQQETSAVLFNRQYKAAASNLPPFSFPLWARTSLSYQPCSLIQSRMKERGKEKSPLIKIRSYTCVDYRAGNSKQLYMGWLRAGEMVYNYITPTTTSRKATGISHERGIALFRQRRFRRAIVMKRRVITRSLLVYLSELDDLLLHDAYYYAFTRNSFISFLLHTWPTRESSNDVIISASHLSDRTTSALEQFFSCLLEILFISCLVDRIKYYTERFVILRASLRPADKWTFLSFSCLVY